MQTGVQNDKTYKQSIIYAGWFRKRLCFFNVFNSVPESTLKVGQQENGKRLRPWRNHVRKCHGSTQEHPSLSMAWRKRLQIIEGIKIKES
jgi:hypothetical protein